jgi:hypothetical protein
MPWKGQQGPDWLPYLIAFKSFLEKKADTERTQLRWQQALDELQAVRCTVHVDNQYM